MIYPSDINELCFEKKGRWYFTGCKGLGYEYDHEINNVTSKLMQFTGLMDKDDNRIYEGDVCKNGDWEADAHAYNYRIEIVEYIEKEGCYRGWNFNEDGMTCEIIGNICENLELIESKV